METGHEAQDRFPHPRQRQKTRTHRNHPCCSQSSPYISASSGTVRSRNAAAASACLGCWDVGCVCTCREREQRVGRRSVGRSVGVGIRT